MNLRRIEALRQQYRPDRVRLLFVGESPPSGGTFFYAGDSGLYRATREAFLSVYARSKNEAFLDFFMSLGCFLDDLCHQPVDDLAWKSSERLTKRDRCVPHLTQRLRKTLPPMAVLCVMVDIDTPVRRAIDKAGLGELRFTTVPFPNPFNRRRYVTELTQELRYLRKRGVIK